VAAGVPTGTVLASESIPVVAIPVVAIPPLVIPGTAMRPVFFATPTFVVAGTTYAIVARRADGSDIGLGHERGSSPYPAGAWVGTWALDSASATASC
jgi:hypothetical protein